MYIQYNHIYINIMLVLLPCIKWYKYMHSVWISNMGK